MDVKYRNLISNTKIFAIGNIVSKLSQYFLITLCTYKLTPAEYGISETVIQTCAMLVPIFSADIAEGLFRFAMDKTYSRGQVLTNSLVINVVGSMIAVLAFPIECLILREATIAVYISLLTLLELYVVSIKEFIRGLGLTRLYMKSGFINSFAQIFSCVIYVYALGLGIAGYILCIATGYLSEIIYCTINANLKTYLNKTAISKLMIVDLLKYSLPLAPNKIMWWIISVSDRYFVLAFIGATATGLYSVAAKFPALITIIAGFFFQAWQISAIESIAARDKDVFFSNIFNMLCVSIGIMTAIAIMVIKIVVSLLVSPEYSTSWEYAPFLLTSAAFSVIQSFLGVSYTIAKDSIGALRSTIVGAISNLILNCTLITNIGIQGATIATMTSMIIVSICRYYDTKKYIRIIINRKRNLFITYTLLIVESTILAIYPNKYYLSVVFSIIIISLNVSSIKIMVFKILKNL